MSKFNGTLTKGRTKTLNFAGGEAYRQSDQLALISLLLTSFVNDQFYRGADETLEQMRVLLKKVHPVFAAKAAIYARDRFGMRSISHAMASELAQHTSGQEWGKSFFDKVVVRVDDMTEIMSYYLENNTDKKSPKFPASLKKGFASAFNKFDDYQIAKWQQKNKEVKLIDIINLCHPVPSDKNKLAISQLVNGTLRKTGTWESELSQAGQQAENEEELGKLKSEAWMDLIQSKKLPLMAMLRNLRNIIEQAPEAVDSVCQALSNENFIKNSRVLPFRFNTAYEEILKLSPSIETRKILNAISVAMDISCKNIPVFEDTLFVVDVSGSMGGRPSEIASLFAAMFAKSNNCDVMTFSNTARYASYNPNDSVMTIRNSFKFSGGGTNFKSIFQNANRPYGTIIIASDMQGWVGSTTPSREFSEYKKKFNCTPHVFSLDLAGLGTMVLPEQNVFGLAGFSDKIFQIMSLLKEDKLALIKEIETISL